MDYSFEDKENMPTVKPYADHSKKVFACKIIDDCEFSAKQDLIMLFKEIKLISMLGNEYCIR